MAIADSKTAETVKTKGLFSRLRRDRSGATAVEFAILIIPFIAAIFATFETFIAFTAEQVVANAVDDMARQVRTGNITFGMGRATDMTEAEFRAALCDEISLVIKCSADEIATPGKLYVDFQNVAAFGDIPAGIPYSNQSLDTSVFQFNPGNSGAINSLRVYYRWTVITDFFRPMIANLKAEGASTPSEFLIVATTAFRNEDYP